MTKTTIRRRLMGLMFRLPMMITCEEFESFIVDYLDGTLPLAKRRKFELHLRVCRECRDYLAAYQAAREAARQALSDDPVPPDEEVPEDLVAAVVFARSAKP